MENSKPLILISNDDGYHAKGLSSLIDMVSGFGSLLVCAPESARSGFSRAFSATTPLRLKLRRRREGVEVWSCNGTPVDCVKLALSELCGGRRPDIVIGGINHGDNASVNAHYSGTMGAATEAALYGIPSIGLSLTDHSPTADFTASVHYGREIIARVLGMPAERIAGLCLNVNIPNIPLDEIQGIRVCRQTRGNWREDFIHRTDPNNRDYYWMSGRFYNFEQDAQESDEWALRNGYVAIVPVQMDLTDYARLDLLRGHMER